MKDIILNETNDLVFVNGDFKLDYSDEQNMASVIRANKGEFKQFPTIGVGIDYFLNSAKDIATQHDLEREIDVQFKLNKLNYTSKDIDFKLD